MLFICWFSIIKSGRRDVYFYSKLCTFLHFLMYKNNNAIILHYTTPRLYNLTHAFTYKFKSEMPFLSKIEKIKKALHSFRVSFVGKKLQRFSRDDLLLFFWDKIRNWFGGIVPWTALSDPLTGVCWLLDNRCLLIANSDLDPRGQRARAFICTQKRGNWLLNLRFHIKPSN